MLPFKLSQKARDDLIGIARYTEEIWGRDQRRLYLKKLDSMFYILADTPAAGSPRDDLRPGYFQKKEGSHLIFYRLGASSQIEIIRILHIRMDAARYL